MPEGESATVALVFCDLVESTALAVELGAGADEVRHLVFDALRTEVSAHRGTEVKNLGDGLMVSFLGVVDAVRSARGMQQQVDALARSSGLRLALRVGVAVGEATFEDGDWFGTPVVEAARLCAAAAPGQILASDVVRVLLGTRSEMVLTPVGELTLKGLPAPVAASSVRWDALEERSRKLPLPRAFALAPRFPLAGRAEQAERLRTAWKEAAAGTCRTGRIAGEPGVGKTRLAAELARAVDEDGAFVLLGRCDDGIGMPYQPFVEALSHVVGHASDADLPSLLGAGAGELCRLVPEIGSRIAGVSPTQADPESERYLLFEAVATCLSSLAQVAPVLLVLDDLHWAAEQTLRLLRHVLRSERSSSLLLLVTYRDTEVDRTHPLGALLADLRRDEGVDRLSLHGLDDEGIVELVERATGRELNDQARALARAVREETGGNPFFAIEVLVSLAERGSIYQGADGVWRSDVAVEHLGIPEGVKEVVGQRLSALPPSCDSVLHVAAVAGQEFELDLVARMVGDDLEGVIDALESARAAGLLDDLGGRPVRYRFAHALVQQTLLDEIPTARRLRTHRAAAEAIEELRASSMERYLAALARHWYEAGTEPERAFGSSMAAARQATEQFAYPEALQWLAQVADLLDDADASTESRVDVAILTGEVMRRSGDEQHREVLLVAGRQAAGIGDAERMAQAALANGRGFQSDVSGTDLDRVAALRDSVEAIGDSNQGLRAQLLVRLAVESLYSTDHDELLGLVDEAMVAARASADPAVIASVLEDRHNVLLAPDTLSLRREGALELLELAGVTSDQRTLAVALSQNYFWKIEEGDVEGAKRDVERMIECGRGVNEANWHWVEAWMQSGVTRLEGDLDLAREWMEKAFERGAGGGMPDANVFHDIMQIGLLLDTGDTSNVLAADQLLDGIPRHYVDGMSLVLALLEVIAGSLDAARGRRDKANSSPFMPWSASGGAADSQLVSAQNSAYLDAALGEATPTTPLAYDVLSRWPGQFSGNLVWVGPSEVGMAAIAPLAGHAESLDVHLNAGLERADTSGSPVLAMYARIFGACGLRIRGAEDDVRRARRMVDEAVALGNRFGFGVARAAADAFPSLQD